MRPMNTFLMILLLATTTTFSSSSSSSSPIGQAQRHRLANTGERDALLAFKKGITGDPNGRLASWDQGQQDCCKWTGVQCSNQTGHVVGLDLHNERVNPVWDLDMTALSGQISPSLFSLHHLEHLDLSSNNLSGPLLSEISMLSSLLDLDLSDNKLTGPIPSGISMLSSLVTLDLSNNQLTGPIPSEIGMLGNLLELELSNNKLTGPVPTGISMLGNLTQLDLSNNNLSGVITHEHLGGLTSLTWIDLSLNSLKILLDQDWLPPFTLEVASFASCEMGPLFPTWLQSQTSISSLDISSASISDRIPDLFFTTFSNGLRLDISNNAISGTLPNDLQNSTIGSLFLKSNNLSGPVPPLPKFLIELDVSENNLSGPLPSNLGYLALQYLNLASNRINGPIPEFICQLDSLGQLNLANNHLEGEFPLCLKPGGASVLILRNNKLSGEFPASLNIWTNLNVLDLAWNKFSGGIPPWIGDLSQLRVLQLSHNMFTGSIPSTITGLERLSQLNLAGNSISGPLPQHFSSFTGMTIKFFWGSNLPPDLVPKIVEQHPPGTVNLSVIAKGQERYYKDDELYKMVSIDLSSNQLTGGIPEGIASLDAVINLNLSWNQLTGKIPGNIGVMQSLESLDLKRNKLYGEIPRSLSNVTYLGYLDLSYNNLTGQIPSGGQLDTLYAQYPFMYNGNSGLCGLPLLKKCSSSSEPKYGDHERDEHDSKLMSFSFGLGIGFVIGLWMVFCVSLFKKSWRIAYFRLVDKTFDKVCVLVVVAWARWAKRIDKD